VLQDNSVIVASGKEQYGAMYFLSPQMEQNYQDFLDILTQVKFDG
jgi:hypothetical protein